MAIAISTAKPRKSGFLAELVQSVRSWRQRQAAAAELRALDDRMLNDLGITRGEIDRVVRDGSRR